MEITGQNLRVKMVHENLAEAPRYPLTAGYSLRWFQEGDDLSWRKVQLETEKYNDITETLFSHEFGTNLLVHSKRICFLERQSDGRLVGTASAWWEEKYDNPELGRIHWVAIVPSFQGLGLSKGLLSAVCLRLVELGHVKAYLSTSTARLPALNLYRLFGFKAVAETKQEWEAWKLIEQNFKSGLSENFPPKVLL